MNQGTRIREFPLSRGSNMDPNNKPLMIRTPARRTPQLTETAILSPRSAAEQHPHRQNLMFSGSLVPLSQEMYLKTYQRSHGLPTSLKVYSLIPELRGIRLTGFVSNSHQLQNCNFHHTELIPKCFKAPS